VRSGGGYHSSWNAVNRWEEGKKRGKKNVLTSFIEGNREKEKSVFCLLRPEGKVGGQRSQGKGAEVYWKREGVHAMVKRIEKKLKTDLSPGALQYGNGGKKGESKRSKNG